MNSNLTSYEAFQLERYGNILQADRLLTPEVIENNSAEMEADSERVTALCEFQLLNP